MEHFFFVHDNQMRIWRHKAFYLANLLFISPIILCISTTWLFSEGAHFGATVLIFGIALFLIAHSIWLMRLTRPFNARRRALLQEIRGGVVFDPVMDSEKPKRKAKHVPAKRERFADAVIKRQDESQLYVIENGEMFPFDPLAGSQPQHSAGLFIMGHDGELIPFQPEKRNPDDAGAI